MSDAGDYYEVWICEPHGPGQLDGTPAVDDCPYCEIARLREENERLRAPDGGSGVEAWRRCYARLDERFAKLSEAIDNLVIIRDGQDA